MFTLSRILGPFLRRQTFLLPAKFAAGTVLCGLAVALVGNYYASGFIRVQANNKLELVAERGAVDIQSFLENQTKLLSAQTTDPTVVAAVRNLGLTLRSSTTDPLIQMRDAYAKPTDDGKPAIIFASHLGNWEIPALGAVAHGLDCAILFRRPNIESADRAIERIRAVKMGTLVPAGREAPLKLAEALQRGQHIAMLVDQYMGNGVEVTFFGRKTKANPTLARLLRQVDCPVHGVRIIRLPNHRFRAELSEEVKPARDASGQIDIQGTMQAVTDVIEGWVREYPDQWLWLHRRWR